MSAPDAEARRVRKTEQMRRARLNQEYRKIERERDAAARREKRVETENQENEQAINTKRRRMARENSCVRVQEQVRDTLARRTSREDASVRLQEQVRNTVNRRTARNTDSFDKRISEFRCKIQDGPTLTCTTCGNLFFRNQVRYFPLQQLLDKFSSSFVNSVNKCPVESTWICHTCCTHVKGGKIPRTAICNGFYYPPIPEELSDLTPLEERLCAARIPFMQIRSLGVDRQCGLKGNVVNIWHDVEETAKILPRKFSEASTIQLAFMRKMSYTNPYMFETVRPVKIYNATRYLCNTPLYKKENIVLSDEWLQNHSFNEENFLVDENETTATEDTEQAIDNPIPDDAFEIEEAGADETLIHHEDVSEGLRYAPGEGRRPISLLRDLDAELLSFPSIYCGQPRNLNPSIKYSYHDIAKSEARRSDRRGCTPAHLLYQYKLLQIHNIASAVNINMRKRKLGTVSAQMARSKEFISQMVQHDDGYRVLKGIRSSPAHWEQEKKKIMAMIKNLGLPTLFTTLSSAEARWSELIKILSQVLLNKSLSNEDIEQMSWEEKIDLIRKDPITCARHFQHRFQVYLTQMLKTNVIFEEFTLEDFYFRVEFQNRGSPHIHAMLWLKGAPKFDEKDTNTHRKCCEFADRFISCAKTDEFAPLQNHKHSFTCRRMTKEGEACRFGFPLPPMKETQILFPHCSKRSKNLKFIDQKNLHKIRRVLENYRRRKRFGVSYEEFINQLEINEEDYISAVRSSIKRPTVFLKRNPDDAYMNAYNVKIAKSWDANSDVQFILDPWGCAKYITNYISKSPGGVSKLLRKAAEEIRNGNLQIKDKLWTLGNCFLNSVEISAQEAAFGVLSLPMSYCSRQVVFIPTGEPEKRVFLLKGSKELQMLPEDSTEITHAGLLQHYSNRPPEMENECLASFAAWYTFRKTKPRSKPATTPVEIHEEEAEEPIEHEDSFFTLPNNGGYLQRRTKRRIIRYCNFSEHTDPNNFYREQCMLFIPWRCETTDILGQDGKQLFDDNQDLIRTNGQEFDPFNYENLIENVQDIADEEAAAEESDDETTGIDQEYQSFFADETDIHIFGDMGVADRAIAERFQVPNLVPDNEYVELTRKLNRGQRKYFTRIMKKIRAQEPEICEMVGGGAGVGKSTLIKVIVQAVTRFAMSRPGYDPSTPSVLLCAPTGRAAFGIKGMTLHSAFSLPLNQCSTLPPLDPSKRNSLFCLLRQILLIIIDEISMVSARQLIQIDCRLRDIFGSSIPFAGIPMVVLGDFNQLSPVGGSPVFKPMRDDFGSISGPALWRRFKFFELTEVMRQRDDLAFAEALNRLATGALTNEDIEIFRSREISSDLQAPRQAVHLFATNADVDHFNEGFLNSLKTEGAVAEAFDIVSGNPSPSAKDEILRRVKGMSTQQTQCLPKSIQLKVTAKYLITTNIDVKDGLVNGTVGILERIIYKTSNDGKKVPVKLLFDFIDECVGNHARSLCGRRYGRLTPISVLRKEIYSWPKRKLAVTRIQFPVTPAEAITFHKSQGGTYPQGVVVHMNGPVTREKLYVGCSRATASDGLFFEGPFQPPKPAEPTHPTIVELNRLRTECQIQFDESEDVQPEENTLKILFHNVQSFHAHSADIQGNVNSMSCDILLFAEPWTLSSDILDIPNYQCVYRLDCPDNRRRPYGFLAFAKTATPLRLMQQWQRVYKGSHAEIAHFDVDWMSIVVVYKSPKFPTAMFLDLLQEPLVNCQDHRTIIVGDFNLNYQTSASYSLKEKMQDFGFEFILRPNDISTTSETLIDLCFSNFPLVQAVFSEDTFSQHHPMIISVPKV